MPTVREQVLAAFCSAVGGEYFKPAPTDERELPLTVVVDGADENTFEFGYENLSMPVTVARAEAPTGSTGAAYRDQGHNILESLYTAVVSDATLEGLADGIDYQGGEISADAGKFVVAEATFVLRYHHVRGDPSTKDEP